MADQIKHYAHLVVDVSADSWIEFLQNVARLRLALEPFKYKHSIVTEEEGKFSPITKLPIEDMETHEP